MGSHFQNRVSLRHTLSSMWPSMHFVTVALRQLLFVVVDATYIKVRENHRIVSKALLVAIGLTDGGLKEIIGISLADAETKESWTSFIRLLAARGRRNDGDGAFHLNTQGVYVPQTTLEDLTRR